MTGLTRRLVLTGAMAQVAVACGAPKRKRGSLSLRDCREIVKTMFAEVFHKTHNCRQIAKRAGFPVTAGLERREINRGLDQVKDLFDLWFIDFAVSDGREATNDGYDYAWSIRFNCQVDDQRNDITFKMSFDAL